MLAYQTRMVEEALTGEAELPAKITFPEDFHDGPGGVTDAVESPQHTRTGKQGKLRFLPVSYSRQVFKLAPGVSKDSVIDDIAHLARMTPVYRVLSDHTREVVLWHYTSLESGLHSVYPGHGTIPRFMDHRQQIWYRRAMNNGPSWTLPYVDPGTRQIVVAAVKPVKGPDKRIAGVTAVVIPMGTMLDHRFLGQNMPAGTQPFLCYTQNSEDGETKSARIIARQEHSDITHRRWGLVMEPEWLTSDDEQSFQTMLKELLSGAVTIRRMPFEGQDCIWTTGPTQNGGFLALITPYAEILNLTGEAAKKVQGQIDNQVRVTLYGLSILVVLIVTLAITFSKTVTKPIQALTEGAQRLAGGDFTARVSIGSRDEFGDMGKVFNSVGPQLKEHYDLQQSLDLARQVQQNLLPKEDPSFAGLDIAGNSIYCDDTGGDYYDFFPLEGRKRAELGVVVGDVAGHGLPSALLMTTARALIRQRVAMSGSLDQIVRDVNRQLARDVEDSGQFMTLFIGTVDMLTYQFQWVRAGHDPAILYDRDTDTFAELKGSGLPLGVFKNTSYSLSSRSLKPGQLILIGTDGIWEAIDEKGRMFGKRRIKEIIRRHFELPSKTIVRNVITELNDFRSDHTAEDDVTLVILKIVEHD
jgi:sigma-B regulation protein RsbU (phosphoserine phosphatase)